MKNMMYHSQCFQLPVIPVVAYLTTIKNSKANANEKLKEEIRAFQSTKIYAVFLYKNIVLIFYVKSFYHYYIVKIFLIQLNIIYIISKSDNLLSNQ